MWRSLGCLAVAATLKLGFEACVSASSGAGGPGLACGEKREDEGDAVIGHEKPIQEVLAETDDAHW